jgi:hypothetical protein
MAKPDWDAAERREMRWTKQQEWKRRAVDIEKQLVNTRVVEMVPGMAAVGELVRLLEDMIDAWPV